MVKKFQDWLTLPQNIASFACPPNAKISAFHQTAFNSDIGAQPVDLSLAM
jgi:hypothetical protein